MKDVPEVLFVCVQNAGRSLTAAALRDHRAAGKVEVRFAGSAAADRIHGNVAVAMAGIGLDLFTEFPKPLTDEVVHVAAAIITMGCGDACPSISATLSDWGVPDPADNPPRKSLPSVTRSISWSRHDRNAA